VLNYVVTCNHIHLLVKDTGRNVIAQSMQLIAGRTAQEYNQRKARGGAFREDRYHATAIFGVHGPTKTLTATSFLTRSRGHLRLLLPSV
jgi:putative transposase